MKFIQTGIPDVIIIEPSVFGDERGYFLESFNQNEFEKNIGNIPFVQDNESKSSKGVLRGLHFQKPPYAQAKLVRCIAGEVLDVIVDIRKNSKTFGKSLTVKLTGENKRQLFVPRGFLHGFVVLSDYATFAYKVDNYYAAEYEEGIMWNDPDLAIDWQIDYKDVILSDKDKILPYLKAYKTPFI
jgi:dTDP-4-dehydrorhamnose 3,5-epimerase